MRHKPIPALDLPAAPAPLHGPLAQRQPLRWLEVSPPSPPGPRALLDALLHRYHYLGYGSPVGENLQYLVQDQHGRPLACVFFGAAAWQSDLDARVQTVLAHPEQNLGFLEEHLHRLALPPGNGRPARQQNARRPSRTGG